MIARNIPHVTINHYHQSQVAKLRDTDILFVVSHIARLYMRWPRAVWLPLLCLAWTSFFSWIIAISDAQTMHIRHMQEKMLSFSFGFVCSYFHSFLAQSLHAAAFLDLAFQNIAFHILFTALIILVYRHTGKKLYITFVPHTEQPFLSGLNIFPVFILNYIYRIF